MAQLKDIMTDLPKSTDPHAGTLLQKVGNEIKELDGNSVAKASDVESLVVNVNSLVGDVEELKKNAGSEGIPLTWEKGGYNTTHGAPVVNDQIRSKLFSPKADMQVIAAEPLVVYSAYLIFYNSPVASRDNFVRSVNILNNKMTYKFTSEDENLFCGIVLAETNGHADIDYGSNFIVGYRHITSLATIGIGYGNLFGVRCGDNVFPQQEVGMISGCNANDGWVKAGEYSNAARTIVFNCVSGFFRLEPGTYKNATTDGDGYTNPIKVMFYDELFYPIATSPIVYGGPTNMSDNRFFTAPEGTKWARVTYNSSCKEMMIVRGRVSWTGGHRPYEEDYPKFKNYDVVPSDVFKSEIDSLKNASLNGELGIARFLHVTDTHIGMNGLDESHSMLFQSMIDVAKSLACDFIVHTGDVVSGSSNTTHEVWEKSILDTTALFANCEIPLIVSRGNHDDNSFTRGTANIISNTWWNNHVCKAINSNSRNFVFPANSNGYFYYDICGKKLRVVNVNAEDLTDAERLSTGGLNFAKVSQSQLDWLDNEALAVAEGWNVIIVSHISCDSGRPNMAISNATELYNVIKNHKGKVIAYVYGHTHISVNYYNSELGCRFISVSTAGGTIVTYTENGHNWSRASQAARKACPTGSMIFDLCVINDDYSISRYRFGCRDDEFDSNFDQSVSYVNQTAQV